MRVLSLDEALHFLQEITGQAFGMEVLKSLISTSLLPSFLRGDEHFVLSDDLQSLTLVLECAVSHPPTKFLARDLFSAGIPAETDLGGTTTLGRVEANSILSPVFFAAERNLAEFCSEVSDCDHDESRRLQYFPHTSVRTASKAVIAHVNLQMERAKRSSFTKSSQFANSAYYMGSKRLLSEYLVEGISSVLPEDGVLLDLMCGSGAASAAFNRSWDTWASDAMSFCQTLAIVQGAGFSEHQADNLLNILLPMAREHSDILKRALGDVMNREDELFHENLDADLLSRYSRFLDEVPTYPSDTRYKLWCPLTEVESRKADWRKSPYCLFTSYFSNVYFGVRQCVEIDSLRFAIDQLEDATERQWALGALIAAMSALGTTYAGHFAQPVVRDVNALTLKRLAPILERRAASILHEFSIRLSNLARESEGVERTIHVIDGPWNRALEAFRDEISDRPAVVYLDAPYKRDEYSRYYHVLETLVAYNYPSSIGKGRVPDRKSGELFQSEFFTRTQSRIDTAFVTVIAEVLNHGWPCAWSYSDNGDACIPSVIEAVTTEHATRVRSFAAPFEHKPQGGQVAKHVTEYLILFEPQ